MDETASPKDSIIGMQIGENGKALQNLKALCITLKNRLIKITLPEQDEEKCEKLVEEQMSDMRSILKVHQEEIKCINKLITDVVNRLEL